MELTYTDTIYDFQGLYDNLWECEHVLETIEDADREEEAWQLIIEYSNGKSLTEINDFVRFDLLDIMGLGINFPHIP